MNDPPSFEHELKMAIVVVRMASAESRVDQKRSGGGGGGFDRDLENRVLLDSRGMVEPADHQIPAATPGQPPGPIREMSRKFERMLC